MLQYKIYTIIIVDIVVFNIDHFAIVQAQLLQCFIYIVIKLNVVKQSNKQIKMYECKSFVDECMRTFRLQQ